MRLEAECALGVGGCQMSAASLGTLPGSWIKDSKQRSGWDTDVASGVTVLRHQPLLWASKGSFDCWSKYKIDKLCQEVNILLMC